MKNFHMSYLQQQNKPLKYMMPLLAIPQQNMKLSKDQISKIVQSGGSFCSWLAN